MRPSRNKKTDYELVDRHWDDEGVLPEQLGPDTQYLFARMTEETLDAVGALPGEWILDIGCGRGLDLASLHTRGATLFGFDASHVMIRKTAETFRTEGLPSCLSCTTAEHLPLRNQCFDKVYCKGAIDHFYDPELAISEMVRILRPGGRLVISVANFESLGCRLGKLYNQVHRTLKGRELPKPHFWEIPEDHIYKFDHPFLLRLLPNGLLAERNRGVSLFWGCPLWGDILRILPRRVSEDILMVLDRVARFIPQWADVIVVCAQRPSDQKKGSYTREDIPAQQGIGLNGEVTMKKTYSRMQGLLLCLATSVAAILFLIGIVAKSYWALAIPVGLGFIWLLGLGFWIGWTLMTIKVEPDKD